MKDRASGTGSSWNDATGDLQGAINSLTATGGQVWVAAGIYKPTSNTANRGASFTMKNGVAIYGGFNGTETALGQRPAINPLLGRPSSTTLSGDIDNDGTLANNSYHIIYNPSSGVTASAVLDGFVVTGGNSNGSPNDFSGGGICNLSSSPTVANCLFQSNSATTGGAMCNSGLAAGSISSPTLTNCLFQSNSATTGGAIANSGSLRGGISSPTLTNCSFQSNSATTGGAMYNVGSSGGRSNPTLANCLFQRNSATTGGAMYNTGLNIEGQMGGTGSNPALTSCAFQSNSATNNGGAIYNFSQGSASSSPTLTNCSFQSNSATAGGAIYNGGDFGGSSSTTLTNCVIFGNGKDKTITNANLSSIFPTLGLFASYSLFEDGVTGFSDNGNNFTGVTTSPFASPTSTQLSACSQAINTGSNAAYTSASGPNTDLAGNPRFFNGGQIDMGAYEFQGTSNFPVAIINQPAAGSVVCAGSNVTATVSVTGTVTGYQWYNTNGAITGQNSATLSIPNLQTSNAGSYSVVVTGACNSVSSNAFSLTVNTAPIPTLRASGRITCATAIVSLSATGGTSYTLTGGAGLQTNTTGSFLVNQAASYTVTVANASGCVASASTTVELDNTAPSASLVSNGNLTCGVTSVTLTASGGTVYNFSGPGVVSQSGTTAVVNAAGLYSVTVTNGATGCSSVTSIAVSQNNALPSVSIQPASATLTNTVPTISLTASGGGTYRWDDNSTNAVRSINTAGTFSVTVTASNGCSNTATATVSDARLPLTLTVIATPNSILTNGSSLLGAIAVGGTMPYTYIFSGPGTIVQSGNTAIVSSLPVGVQSFTITVRDATLPTNQIVSQVVTVIVNPVPVVVTSLSLTASASPSTILTNGSTTLLANASGGTPGYTYSFSGPGTIVQNGSTATVSGLPVGVQSFTVGVRDASGPINQLVSQVISVTVNAVPVVVTSLSLTASANPTTILTSGTTTLIANALGGTPGYTYSFNGPGTIVQSGNTATVSGLPVGVQSFTVGMRDATVPTNQLVSQVVSVTVNAVLVLGTSLSPTAPALTVAVLGNPVSGEALVEIGGAAGQSLQLRLVDLTGMLVETRSVAVAAEVERQSFKLGRASSVLLQVSGSGWSKTIRIVQD